MSDPKDLGKGADSFLKTSEKAGRGPDESRSRQSPETREAGRAIPKSKVQPTSAGPASIEWQALTEGQEPWGPDWWKPGSRFKLKTRKFRNIGRRQRPFPEGSIKKIRAAIKNARTKWQLQQAQCLWLRAIHGLTALEIALTIGWAEASVRRFHARCLREGDAVLAGPGRGGRRNYIMGFSQEQILLRKLRREYWPNAVVGMQQVQDAYDAAAGRHVAPSTIYRMLARHGWRRTPVVGIPDPVGPARSYFIRLGVIEKKRDNPDRKRFDRWKNGW